MNFKIRRQKYKRRRVILVKFLLKEEELKNFFERAVPNLTEYYYEKGESKELFIHFSWIKIRFCVSVFLNKEFRVCTFNPVNRIAEELVKKLILKQIRFDLLEKQLINNKIEVSNEIKFVDLIQQVDTLGFPVTIISGPHYNEPSNQQRELCYDNSYSIDVQINEVKYRIFYLIKNKKIELVSTGHSWQIGTKIAPYLKYFLESKI